MSHYENVSRGMRAHLMAGRMRSYVLARRKVLDIQCSDALRNEEDRIRISRVLLICRLNPGARRFSSMYHRILSEVTK